MSAAMATTTSSTEARNETPTAAEVKPTWAMPWWSSPAGISLGFLIPILLLTVAAGEADLSTLTIRGIRFISATSLAIVGGMILVAALGGWLGDHIRWPGTDTSRDPQWDTPAMLLGCIALVAYVVWFRPLLFSPATLYDIFSGKLRFTRDSSMLTPGITSLANVAPVFFAVYAYRTLLSQDEPVARRMHVMAALLVAMTLFRAQIWSERLAVIEMAAPFGLALAPRLMRQRGMFMNALRVGGPYLALPLVIVLFGVAEYSRSWTSDTYRDKTGFWAFAIGRLVSYYYTALNNGAGMLATFDWPTYSFDFTLTWLRSAPLLLGPLFSEVVGESRRIDLVGFLALYGDPEFNSPSGMFSALVDLGGPLGVLYVFVTGLFSGFMFRAYRERRLVGVLLYPMCFIAFLEVLRYLYLGQPRAFTTVVGCLLLIGFVKLSKAASEWKARAE
jgi:hypothetical protein